MNLLRINIIIALLIPLAWPTMTIGKVSTVSSVKTNSQPWWKNYKVWTAVGVSTLALIGIVGAWGGYKYHERKKDEQWQREEFARIPLPKKDEEKPVGVIQPAAKQLQEAAIQRDWMKTPEYINEPNSAVATPKLAQYPLASAIIRGASKEEILKIIDSSADKIILLNDAPNADALPLVLAIKHNKSLIKDLVALGAKVDDERAVVGSLRLAIKEKLPLDDMEALIKAGALLSSDKIFVSPIGAAIEYKDAVRAKFILDHNVPVTTNDFIAAFDAEILMDIAYEMLKHLVTVDVKEIQRFKNLLLTAAIDKNDINLAKNLIKQGADVNADNETLDASLRKAINKGSSEFVTLLLESGAEILPGDLSIAIRTKASVEIIQQLLKYGANVDEKSWGTPVVNFAIDSAPYAVKLLIDHGAELDINQTGRAILARAIENNVPIDAIALLIENGAPVNVNGLHRPLDKAILKNDPAIVRLLLEHGAEIRPSTLSFALENNAQLGVIHELLKHGANPNNQQDVDPSLISACWAKAPIEVIRELINHGADVNLKRAIAFVPRGVTPLLAASFMLYVEAVDLLIQEGADVNLQDDNGRTALMEVCDIRGPDKERSVAALEKAAIIALKLINEYGADVNKRDNFGSDALGYLGAAPGGDYLKYYNIIKNALEQRMQVTSTHRRTKSLT